MHVRLASIVEVYTKHLFGAQLKPNVGERTQPVRVFNHQI